jgi:hypothetical protein
MTVTATAKDVYGNTTPSYGGAVTLSFAPTYGGPGPSETSSLISSSAGVSTFSATLYLAGARAITATGTPTSLVGATGVTINPGALSTLAVTGLAAAVAGKNDMTVTAQDSYGNTKTDYQGQITFSTTDTNVTLSVDDSGINYVSYPYSGLSYTFTTGTPGPGIDNGVHTFIKGVNIPNCSPSGSVTVFDSFADVFGSEAYPNLGAVCAPLPPPNQNGVQLRPAFLLPPNSRRNGPPG